MSNHLSNFTQKAIQFSIIDKAKGQNVPYKTPNLQYNSLAEFFTSSWTAATVGICFAIVLLVAAMIWKFSKQNSKKERLSFSSITPSITSIEDGIQQQNEQATEQLVSSFNESSNNMRPIIQDNPEPSAPAIENESNKGKHDSRPVSCSNCNKQCKNFKGLNIHLVSCRSKNKI